MQEEMNKLPYIIAIDFDGTLVEDQFPEIGESNDILMRVAPMWREAGAKLILWTCRNGEYLDKAVKYCKDRGLEFDAVNENIPEVQTLFGGDTRKVYANIYIDDKAVTPVIYIDEVTRSVVDAIGDPDNE